MRGAAMVGAIASAIFLWGLIDMAMAPPVPRATVMASVELDAIMESRIEPKSCIGVLLLQQAGLSRDEKDALYRVNGRLRLCL